MRKFRKPFTGSHRKFVCMCMNPDHFITISTYKKYQRALLPMYSTLLDFASVQTLPIIVLGSLSFHSAASMIWMHSYFTCACRFLLAIFFDNLCFTL